MINRYTRRSWLMASLIILLALALTFQDFFTDKHFIQKVLTILLIVGPAYLLFYFYQRRLKKENPDIWKKRFPRSAAYENALNSEGGDLQVVVKALLGIFLYKSAINVSKNLIKEIDDNAIQTASLVKRSVAAVIDGLISFLLFVLLPLPFYTPYIELNNMPRALSYISLLIGILGLWGYPVLSLWKLETTLGKKLFGIKVADINGAHITFRQAFAREVIGKSFSMMLYGIGFLWIIWDKHHQGWHDKIASTVVVKK